jgi:hypothetical protein
MLIGGARPFWAERSRGPGFREGVVVRRVSALVLSVLAIVTLVLPWTRVMATGLPAVSTAVPIAVVLLLLAAWVSRTRLPRLAWVPLLVSAALLMISFVFVLGYGLAGSLLDWSATADAAVRFLLISTWAAGLFALASLPGIVMFCVDVGRSTRSEP